jgi:hypothetical protein
MLDMGLNLIIFDNKIHKTDVITHNMTPPHPRSNDQDVVKMRAGSKSWTPLPPIGLTTPSAVPSESIPVGLLCNLLKWIMVSVKRANDPANKYMTPVTRTALIWCWKTPKAPTRAALPSIIKHTRAQDIDKFCIPESSR